MEHNQTLKDMNTRSKLMAKLGYLPWEVDELTLTAANYAFDDGEDCKLSQMRERIEGYKTGIINKTLR